MGQRDGTPNRPKGPPVNLDPSPEPIEPTPDPPVTLEDIGRLIQRYVNERSSTPCVVTGAMLAWEEARYSDEGRQMRRFGYADVFHTGLAAAIGLMVAGQQQVMDDLFNDDDPTNGDDE